MHGVGAARKVTHLKVCTVEFRATKCTLKYWVCLSFATSVGTVRAKLHQHWTLGDTTFVYIVVPSFTSLLALLKSAPSQANREKMT